MKDFLIPLSIILTIVFMLFTFIVCPVMNEAELRMCKSSSQYNEVIYEENFFLDKCYILEGGEELTLTEHRDKHKYDGVKVRK